MRESIAIKQPVRPTPALRKIRKGVFSYRKNTKQLKYVHPNHFKSTPKRPKKVSVLPRCPYEGIVWETKVDAELLTQSLTTRNDYPILMIYEKKIQVFFFFKEDILMRCRVAMLCCKLKRDMKHVTVA